MYYLVDFEPRIALAIQWDGEEEEIKAIENFTGNKSVMSLWD